MRASILLLLTSCSGIPSAPPFSYETREGTTRAFESRTAERFGREATELSQLVADLLGCAARERFELRILDGETKGSGGASTVCWYDEHGLVERYIQLGAEGRAESRRLLAHELVHWNVGGSWGLPLVVEEGLAECIAAALVPHGDEILARRRRDALDALARDEPLLRDGRPFRIGRARWPRLSPREKHLLYAYGALLVEGVEIEGLREFDHDHRAEAIRAAIPLSSAQRSTR